MNKDWIARNIDYLEDKTNRSNLQEFEPTADFYKNLFESSKFSSVIGKLCSHVGILTVPEVEIVGDSDVLGLDLQTGKKYFEKVIDSAGDIRATSPISSKIRIGIHQLYRVHNVGQILAHEIAHHFLNAKIIRSSKDDEIEMFTDLTAIYIGLGKIIINGAVDQSPKFVNKPIHISSDGIPYLGYPLLSYAYYLNQIKKGFEKHNLYRFVKQPCRDFVRSFEFYEGRKLNMWTRFVAMVSSISKMPDTDGAQIIQDAWKFDERRYRIIKCVGCGVDLKIPKTEKTLIVTCHKCKTEFKVGVKYK
jgi:hypothetical protein